MEEQRTSIDAVSVDKQKSLFISIIGEPNAGKSTLLNSIIGQKISIVTHKVQTTRENIKGILNINDTQLVFIDTPGVFDPKKPLEKFIVKNAFKGLEEGSVTALIIDGKRGLSPFIKEKILHNPALLKNRKLVVLINKVDEVSQEQLFRLTGQLDEMGVFSEIFAISALKNLGVDKFLQHLVSIAKKNPWLYDAEALTDISVRSIAEDITREKVFLHLHRELPYSIKVETDKWEDGEDDDVTVIYQSIFVLKQSQKSIVLGKGGQKIKTIGMQARYEIEQLLEKRVKLYLHVKVREDWIERDFKEFL